MIARLRRFASRALGLFSRPGLNRGFDEELQTHLNLLAERFVRQGMMPEEAYWAARRQFGNTTLLKEERTEMQTFVRLESLWKDLRYGARLLLVNPGFASIVVLTLGLGIGASTAIFSLVQAILLKPPPYHDPERLVVPATVFQRYSTDRGSVAYADIIDWKRRTDLFDAVAAYQSGFLVLTGEEEPERVPALSVDEDYFRIMGRPLLFGRAFAAAENLQGAGRCVVLSHALWMRRWGGDRNVLGSSVEVDGVPHQVIGVAQTDSTWPAQAEIFRPLGEIRDADLRLRRDNHVFRAIARLKDGVPLEQAQARLTVMATQIAQREANRGQTGWKIHSLAAYIVGPVVRRTLLVLFGAVLFILLIACVNVANLLLVRGSTRVREVAIRHALGAGRARLFTQFLTESALLSVAGGLAGVFVAYWALKALVHFAPPEIPWLERAHIDLPVLAFAATLCLATSILAGLLPAVHAAREAPAKSLREAGRAVAGGFRAGRLRGLMAVSELALAIMLLSGAGLLIRSFHRIRDVNPGFPTANLLTMQIPLPSARYPKPPLVAAGFEQIAGAVRQVPGVVSAAAVSSLPLGGGGFYLGRVFLKEGQPEPPAAPDVSAAWSVVQPGYFRTLGIPILLGRAFTDRDAGDSPKVIIISQKMAREMFPGENPLGRRIRSWRDENVYREIVGIVGDVRYYGLTADVRNAVYVPHRQDAWNSLILAVRTGNDSPLAAIRTAIWSVDKKLSIAQVKTMEQVVDRDLAQPRFSMFLLSLFSVTALVLGATGIYGVMAYSVAQRTREIGIRLALGAMRAGVLRMVVGSAFRLAAAGVLCGLAGAWLLTRVMRTLLFEISPTDPRTFLTVAALLAFVALAASYLPALRASKVDPVLTLKYE